ncbi:Endonuclease/Exonuclease/phosphatase [Giardia muris]|uniref:Endonuclease/Exonuclease/phosphatase n=1 Tax=Giardia muris TaxID=5742 RepID=A0A4Z1SSY2_GIAMU|nr:Endonuclease/Exonuclease/phosphatase [Giardia muris]|eukprot:TNJ28105.1 Endonuclease/Exonuclease/phosphatase [Giardia muris]
MKAFKKKTEEPSVTFPYHSLLKDERMDTLREPRTFLAINVNGIRAALKKGLIPFLLEQNPDVICMSETKVGALAYQSFIQTEGKSISNEELPEIIPGYRHIFACSSARQGYASTAIFVKRGIRVIDFASSIGDSLVDTEGRYIRIAFSSFDLIHVYVPNSGRGAKKKPSFKPSFLSERLEYERLIRNHINELQQRGRQVIYCGDLNVAHTPRDIHNPKGNENSPGYTEEERIAMTQLLQGCGLVDTFRRLHPGLVKYSWFSNFGNSRENLLGWRIDYFLVSNQLFERVVESDIIDEKRYFSDHTPITMTLKND